MTQAKAILVPVDFTEAARHAMINAIELGQKLGSAVYLVNFIPPFTKRQQPKSGTTIKNLSGELSSYINLLKENENKLAETLKTVDQSHVEVHSEIKIDKLANGIKKQLKTKEIGLIVIGIGDAHTIGDSFCKTKQAREVIEVDCPIMICSNHNYKFNGYHNIVISLDFNTPDRQNIEKLASIISHLSLTVFYIHVNHPSDERRFQKEDILYYLTKHKLKADSIEIINSNNKEEAIRHYANEQKAAFIAINKFNKSYNYEPCHAEQVAQESENLVFVY